MAITMSSRRNNQPSDTEIAEGHPPSEGLENMADPAGSWTKYLWANKPIPVEIAVEVLLEDLRLWSVSVIGLTAEDRQRHYFRIAAELESDYFSKRAASAADMAKVSVRVIRNRLDRAVERIYFPNEPSSAIPIQDILHRKLIIQQLDRPQVAALLFEELCRLANLPIQDKVEPPPTNCDVGIMLDDDRILLKDGTRYYPMSLAASLAQVPRTTLLNWITNRIEFQGRELQTYSSATARKSYLAEESVRRVANRFTNWKSGKPAGSVHIGETEDGTGYIGIAKAARALGVDHHTVWLWITQESAPTGKLLDVIKCSASEQLYIREKDVSDIRRLIPKAGLRRGRRPRLAFQPS